mgnify:CR=1 FL=1
MKILTVRRNSLKMEFKKLTQTEKGIFCTDILSVQ